MIWLHDNRFQIQAVFIYCGMLGAIYINFIIKYVYWTIPIISIHISDLILIKNLFTWWSHDSSLIMPLMLSPRHDGIHDCIYLIMQFISWYLFTNYYTVYYYAWIKEFLILSYLIIFIHKIPSIFTNYCSTIIQWILDNLIMQLMLAIY